MDERKIIIRELEEKKRLHTEARGRLLGELGEALIGRCGEDGLLPEPAGAVLAEYRGFQREIADSNAVIRSLEADTARLKELEDGISAKEGEESRLSKELWDALARLGKALLGAGGFEDFTASYRHQEESLLAKINEQVDKTKELVEREGGVFVWLGKNAQIAVYKTLLAKNRSSLQRVYRSVGEQFFVVKPDAALDGEAAEAAQNAEALRESLALLTVELSLLKGERRKIGETFGAEGSPSRRIEGLEKRIAFVKEEFPGLYLRFGSLAVHESGRESLASLMRDEDGAVLENAASHQVMVDDAEKKIKKTRASISIDNEKAEIEKIAKAIAHQRQKIAAANDEITDLEKQIGEADARIEELKTFIKENE